MTLEPARDVEHHRGFRTGQTRRNRAPYNSAVSRVGGRWSRCVCVSVYRAWHVDPRPLSRRQTQQHSSEMTGAAVTPVRRELCVRARSVIPLICRHLSARNNHRQQRSTKRQTRTMQFRRRQANRAWFIFTRSSAELVGVISAQIGHIVPCPPRKMNPITCLL